MRLISGLEEQNPHDNYIQQISFDNCEGSFPNLGEKNIC